MTTLKKPRFTETKKSYQGDLYFSLCRPVPESARWLILNGKKDQVLEVLKRIARINKRQLPEIGIASINKETRPGFKHFIRLFTPRKIAIRSLIQGYGWLVCVFPEHLDL